MASIFLDPASGVFQLRFRYEGQSYKRSLKTADEKEARSVQGRVEETLRLIERGRMDIPEGADPGIFILSDGKRLAKKEARVIRTLGDLFETYRKQTPAGSKEVVTLNGERTHEKHLLRLLKPNRLLKGLLIRDLQEYVDARLEEKWCDKLIQPETIQKELTTLRLVWNWAVEQGYLTGPRSLKGLKYPKSDEKQPFQTWDQIETIINRGGLTAEQEQDLWDGLYLTREQVKEVLECVKAKTADDHPFLYPMFAFVAHTGARRSELLRSQINDFDFHMNTVQIREKKKSKKKAMTFRRVAMTPFLAQVMQEWFASHPGGQFTICPQFSTERGKPFDELNQLELREASRQFNRILRDSKWSRIKGFHVFRHSFASNLAAAGVDQRLIDEWLGHTTDEMRRRYRHLFPDVQQKAIENLMPPDKRSICVI